MMIKTMTLLDIFSGIGGFSLAARWAGIETIAFCEIDPYAQQVLIKNFGAVMEDAQGERCQQAGPKQPAASNRPRLHRDIFTLNGADYQGVNIVTGGFPCQPFSLAGKRRGKEDDRFIWPEMLRVIAEARPNWVIGENVAGIINLELDRVLSDLESIGYTVQPFVIPACAVDARHRRDRVWIVGHATRGQYRQHTNGEWKPEEGRIKPQPASEDVADRINAGLEIQQRKPGYNGAECPAVKRSGYEWARWEPEPDVGRVVARLSSTLDGTLKRFKYDNSNYQEAITEIDQFRKQVLLIMWCEERKTESPPLRSERTQNNHTLHEVSCLIAHEKWNLGERIKGNAKLRDMWKSVHAVGFTQSQDLLAKMLERIREIERNEKMASSRVNRLKCLGNAIVPQVAYQILSAIKKIHSRLDIG